MPAYWTCTATVTLETEMLLETGILAIEMTFQSFG